MTVRGGADARPPSGALSVDGRHFSFETAVDGLDMRLGGYVLLGGGGGAERLGYVTGIALAEARTARVDGEILEEPGAPFADASVRVADSEAVASWLDRVRPHRAQLDVGALTRSEGVPFNLDAGAFDRHTFLCGQSGSGKTYALGTILERLLLETSLRIVILDPNSDFAGLGELRQGVDRHIGERYARAAAQVDVRQARKAGDERLHVRFRDFDADERAAVMRLDPIDDRDEYAALTQALEGVDAEALGTGTVRETVDHLWDQPEPFHSLGVRARNLGIDRWEVWSGADPDPLQELVQPSGPRCVIADLGSLEHREEQIVAAEAVLASLWRSRAAREPVLIVIDEAHNVCPSKPPDRLTALSTEHAVRIAGEGRKFGLVLLVVTQRPQKVHENVVSQCDNLVLMRVNSRSDLALLSQAFSFVPESLIGLAAEFGQGEAVVAGKLVPSPTLGRFGPRWSREGGSDIPTDWAAPRRSPSPA